jgi:geranylgeranyl pyrophosphate synthase
MSTAPSAPYATDLSWAADRYVGCLEQTRAALSARLADAPGSQVLNEYVQRGKMVRAYLVFVAAGAVGGECADALAPAVAIELLHAASLVHDDIIDEASQRRGLPALHTQLGLGPGLVLGDDLLFCAFSVLAELRDRFPADRVLRVLGEIAACARQCCRGQYEELLAGPWIDEERYLSIVAAKTAAPFVAAGVLGAVFGGGTERQVECLRAYASRLGVAFQIADDLLDLVGDAQRMGKPVANSLMHQRPLLPLIYLWRDAAEPLRVQLQELSARGWPRPEVVALAETHRVLEAVRQKQRRLVDQAVEELAGLPAGPGIEALREIAFGVAQPPTAREQPGRDPVPEEGEVKQEENDHP